VSSSFNDLLNEGLLLQKVRLQFYFGAFQLNIGHQNSKKKNCGWFGCCTKVVVSKWEAPYLSCALNVPTPMTNVCNWEQQLVKCARLPVWVNCL
jgi:hypothetical protein